MQNHIQRIRGDLVHLANAETDEQQVIIMDMEKLVDNLEIKQEILRGLLNG